MFKKAAFLVAVVMVITMLFAAFPATAAEAGEAEFVRFTAGGNDPYATFSFSMDGNHDRIDPDTVTWAAIRYKTGSQYDSTGVEYTAQFYISPAAEPCVPIRYNFSGNWETAIIDLTSVSDVTDLDSKWDGTFYTATTTIRFDPLEPDRDPENTAADGSSGQVNEGDYIDVAWIAFFEKEDDAKAYTGKENTPYCILDVENLLLLNGANNLKAERYTDEGAVAPTEAPKDAPVKYVLSPRDTGSNNPQAFTGHASTAIEFVVPEGMSFKSLTLSSPTWGAQENANLDAVIYAWNRDYDTTIEGTELGTFRKEKHVDNMELEMDFGVILPPGKYVIVMTAEDDTIGAWNGTYDETGYDAIFYFDDVENDSWFPASWITLINGTEKAIELPTAAPTAEPTAKPTDAPATEVPATAEPTKEAVATDAPATDAPKNTDNGGNKGDDTKESKGLPTGALIGIICGAGVLAAVVVVIIAAKSKKKK